MAFPPIYLHLIFPILQFEISSWIFFQVWTGFFEILVITLVSSPKQHLPKHMQHSVYNVTKGMIDEMSSLPRKSWVWNLRFKFFKGRICNSKERLVYCCYEDQSPPSENQMKLIKTESSGPPAGISDKVYYFSNFSCRFLNPNNFCPIWILIVLI